MALTKKEIIGYIENELPFVDMKPYSHNIISLYLQSLYKLVGKEELNEYIKHSELINLGWKIMN